MSEHRGKREAGFTIIETIMVLAAAAMILLIVLLALPALTRNSRNNQRNQDAQTVLGAVSQWELNHAGTIPDTGSLHSFLTSYYKDRLSLFEIGAITVTTPSADSVPPSYPPSAVPIDQLQVYNHAKCGTGGNATSKGAGYSDVVALYVIETAHGTSPHCQQL
ncbi:MAG TPA: type II secretion system protein [Candidatus Saccharimonadales bacterium]|nr:type II secretion system protein [Candidatus Saccharimonadales bacterium]